MRNRTITTMIVAAATLLALGGFANADERTTLPRSNTVAPSTAPDRTYDGALLEDERAKLAWEAHNAKGVDKADLRSEEARVQEMIDDLQRGAPVDPEEVDRVLNRTN